MRRLPLEAYLLPEEQHNSAKDTTQDLITEGMHICSALGAVVQNFRCQAGPAGNNTSSPSGTLNLLFGAGSSTPTKTGHKVSRKGQITFASGQTFPGTGTITRVTAGTDFSGGGRGTASLNLDTTHSHFR